MTSAFDPLPSDLAAAHAMILAERAARVEAEAVAACAQAVNVSIVDPTASSASTSPGATAPTTPTAEQSRGPLGLNGPVPFLGVAGFVLAVGALFAWVFAQRRHREMTHISL